MTERYALLIGVNEYLVDTIRDLQVALDDVAATDRSLRTSGYDVTTITGGPGRQPPSRGVVRGAIRQFLADVPSGSTALVYFSGHGVHLDGADYVLPWDAPAPVHRGIADDLLPADLARLAGTELDACAATTIVLAVDACRDQLDLTKAAFEEFGSGEQSDASRRRVYTLFACTADATAGFDKQLGASVFTFAFAEAMRAETDPSTLSEVVEFVRDRMVELCREYGLPPQEPAYRLDVDGGSGADRVICSSPADDPTAANLQRAVAALGGYAGDHIDGALDELAQRSIELIRESSRRRIDDVWLDPDLPRRTVDAANVLFEHTAVLRDVPADERLVVTGLLLAVDVALRWAVASGDAPAYLREVERAYRRYPMLERRRDYLNQRGEKVTAQRIEAWVEHRAALAVPELWSAAPFTELIGLLASHVETRATHRTELVAALTAVAIEVVADLPARRPDRLIVVNARALSGQAIDLDRSAVAARLVRTMSADLRMHGAPIVHEIGLRTGLDAQVAAQELAGLMWLVDSDGRMLLPSIRCSEPAVDQVVRGLTAEVRATLVGAGGVLNDVLDVSDREVQPCRLGDSPAYTVPVPAITLDTAAVRQLLVGKDLYGSPEVVVRELYQNALDACRYRSVRERCLDLAAPGRASDWSGRIDLRVHELADGALVLDCLDTGVGMGDVEVDQAFTSAGRRFTDLPSFYEEADRWSAADPDLRLYPNSRFGIGVFSYFMLAEEVEVYTVRQDADGSLQPGLALHLSAASGLVSKRPLPATAPERVAVERGGTLVRLHLDRTEWASLDKNLVDIVTDLLGYAEFVVSVTDAEHSKSWAAETLVGDLAIAFPAFQEGPTRGWWIDDEVPLLSDGIRLSTTTAGYVVNLCGAQQPSLNVSRNVVDRWPYHWVRDRLAASAAGLRAWPGLCLGYLWRLTEADPSLAEDVYRHVGTGWLPLTTDGDAEPTEHERIEYVGVFPADAWLFETFEGISPTFAIASLDDDDEHAESDDRWRWAPAVVTWRGHAWGPSAYEPYEFEQDETGPLQARANDPPERWGRPAPSPLDSALLREVIRESGRPEAVRVPFLRLVDGADSVGLTLVDAIRRLLRFATCDIQPVGWLTLRALAALPPRLDDFPAALRFLTTSWLADPAEPALTLLRAVADGIPAGDIAAAADAVGWTSLSEMARAAGEPPGDPTHVLSHFYGDRDTVLVSVAKTNDPDAWIEWIDRFDPEFGASGRNRIARESARQMAPAETRHFWGIGLKPTWLTGALSWRTILRGAYVTGYSVGKIADVLGLDPQVELPPDVGHVDRNLFVSTREAELLGLLPDHRPGRRVGPVSALLRARRNEKRSAAELRAELSVYCDLGVIPPALAKRAIWPIVSDRELDLIEAWEEMLGEDEVGRSDPRPLDVLETFAFVDNVGGDLHRVLTEIRPLRWCGLRTSLDLAGSKPVGWAGLRLGVLLHRGWEPRIALAAVSFVDGADYVCDENRWWLAQCAEGVVLTTFDIGPVDEDLDYSAQLALVAATRNGAQAPPDIQPSDVMLTAARAQVSVGEVLGACRRLAFDTPDLGCDPGYHPDWIDAALAALLLAVPEPPAATDLEFVGGLIGAVPEDVRDRLHRFGYDI